MNKFPYKIVDLTHTIHETVPSWDDSCGFKHFINCDYDPNHEYQFRAQIIHMAESIGTHIDAPAHAIQGGSTIDQLQLSDLIAPCVVIDVSNLLHERFSLSTQDIESFEKNNGTISPSTFVMVKTGWEQFWEDRDKYRNNHVFPSVSKEAAKLLLDRNVVGIGIDTLSPDRPENGFPVHKMLLGAGKYIVENAANLAALPTLGSFILALPIKTKGGTEAPIRLVGLVN